MLISPAVFTGTSGSAKSSARTAIGLAVGSCACRNEALSVFGNSFCSIIGERVEAPFKGD